MIRSLQYLCVLVVCCCGHIASSQSETWKWYFGNFAALDFSTQPPTNLANGAIATWEGCSSVADLSGNLLFYTNGITVWNKSHLVMANGAGLMGGNSSSQSALIVKQPGNANIYFIFTTDGGGNGLRYSTVDISLATGMGSVTAKNLLINAPSTERLCGTKHCNGTDVWVISHDSYSANFRANLVTASGVNITPVLSNSGSGMSSVGCMKVSPNGKKLGAAIYAPASFEVFDFDASNGLVSNPIHLPVSSPAYGCEFSPDGTKFYGTLWAASSVTYRLRQWDLCAGSTQAIAASVFSYNATHTGQLQLAPDGKIYQAKAIYKNIKIGPETSMETMTGEPMIGVIHNPNAAGASANFNNTGQAVNPAESLFGLPNFVSGFYKTPVAQYTYSINPAVSCLKAFFTTPSLINATCSATSYTINSVKWDFDDPASAASNTSAILNPSHLYPATGTYKVRLFLYNACGGVIDILKQEVVIGGALTNNPSSYSICTGQSIALVAGGASTSYSWSNGATTSSIVITPTSNATYSLSYTDNFGCLRKSVQTVTVYPVPVVTTTVQLKRDTICAGTVVTIKASGAVSYSWNNGSTNSAINATPAVTGFYTVTGTSANGCSVIKLTQIVVKPAPVPVIIANTLVCAGSTATAVAVDNGNATYSWNQGTKGTTLTVVPAEQYIFSVTAKYVNGCSRFERVRFNIRQLPEVTVAGNRTVCAGQEIVQSAAGAVSYTWSTGQENNPVRLAPLQTSTYTVRGADSNNCVRTVTVIITVKPTPSVSISGNLTICEGEGTFLTASGGDQYDWKAAPGLMRVQDNAVVANPVVTRIYTVTASIENCASTGTVEVKVTPKPFLWAGRDTLFSPYNPMFLNATGSGTITWIGGENIACTDCPRTEIFPTQSTCYMAQAISSEGCRATDEVCVDVGPDYAIYLPDAFTPNGDGLNDEFMASGFGITRVKITIVDRWGEMLFTTNAEHEGWDGKFRGEPCKPGIYSYVVEFVLLSGQRKQKAGHLNLIMH
jgi:gliding motility-associated-like protein